MCIRDSFEPGARLEVAILVEDVVGRQQALHENPLDAAALLRGGAIERVFVKSLLPTYDVFDEDRYFEPGPGLEALDVAGRRAAVSVCEDVWNDRDFWQRPRYLADPIDAVGGLGAGVLLNLSASPFSAGKQAVREEMLGVLARSHGVHVVYVNQVLSLIHI